MPMPDDGCHGSGTLVVEIEEGGQRSRDPCRSMPPTSRKEVIQPQVPLRLPCYDFTPVADLTVVGCLPPSFLDGLARRLRVKPTPMV